jgi:hypothetical protein
MYVMCWTMLFFMILILNFSMKIIAIFNDIDV